jgi:hypothetical protein
MLVTDERIFQVHDRVILLVNWATYGVVVFTISTQVKLHAKNCV